MSRTNFAKIFFCIFLPVLGRAEWRGYNKLNNLIFKSVYDNSHNVLASNDNRLSYYASLSKNLRLEFSYEVSLLYLDYQDIHYTSDLSALNRPYRIQDFNSTLTKNGDQLYLTHNFDRLILTYESEKALFTLGRQQFSFGSGYTANPIDVFTPFAFTAIDTEERPGVDALRYRHQVTEFQQLDFGFLFGKETRVENSASYLTYRFTFENFEIQPLVATFLENQLLGLDFSTSISVAHLWLEAARVTPKNENHYDRVVLGAESHVHSDVLLFIELYYNGAGQIDPQNYQSLLGTTAYTEGALYNYGQRYFNLGGNYSLSPLHGFSFTLLSNLNDHSHFLFFAWDWSLSDNSAFSTGIYFGQGEAPLDINTWASEFGTLPQTLFTRLRYYW